MRGGPASLGRAADPVFLTPPRAPAQDGRVRRGGGPSAGPSRGQAGFGLVEILVVVVILAIAGAFSGSSTTPWWALLVIGLVSLFAAAFAILFPGLTAVGLLYVIGFWAIVTGALEIVTAIQLRREIEGEFWLGLAGFASILFGAFLFARPGLGALAVMWMIGTYAVAFGVLLVAHGLHVRSFTPQHA